MPSKGSEDPNLQPYGIFNHQLKFASRDLGFEFPLVYKSFERERYEGLFR